MVQVGIWKLRGERGGMVRGQMPPMHRGKYIPSIVEMPRNTDMERGAPEQQMVTYQQGNSTREDTHCQNCQ
jgi:hypothetical protein